MKRGKAPPIKISMALVGKNTAKAEPTKSEMTWLKRNCLRCGHQNIDRMVTSALVSESIEWKHICCHPGPTKLMPYQYRYWNSKEGGVNCSGFKPNTEFSEQLKLPEKLPKTHLDRR
jgi:hypothetical protein